MTPRSPQLKAGDHTLAEKSTPCSFLRSTSPRPPLFLADQPSLCEGLWQQARSSDAPLLSYLDGLRALFPAFPSPLYRLLAALASSPASAAAAVAYFARLPGLATLQALDGDVVSLDPGEGTRVVAGRDLRLDAAPSIHVPEVRAWACGLEIGMRGDACTSDAIRGPRVLTHRGTNLWWVGQSFAVPALQDSQRHPNTNRRACRVRCWARRPGSWSSP